MSNGRSSSGTCSVLRPASVFESGIQSSFPSSSRSRTTRETISFARIPITSASNAATAPAPPSSASATAFTSHLRAYVALHDEIIRYMKFFRDVSVADSFHDGLLDHWFRFPEVKQNWLGFSRSGTAEAVLERTLLPPYRGT